jgi:iron uptake system EfeUOB component EfeO/EfeM
VRFATFFRTVRPSRIALFALLALALVAAGCGKKSQSTTQSATSTSGDTTAPAPPPGPVITTSAEPPPPPADPLLRQAVEDYQKALKRDADVLVNKTTGLSKALDAGDPETAVGLYPETRAAYERLQAIAVAFGLAQGMDAREDAVPADEWTGFHQIEKTLFDVGTTGGTEASGRKLVADAKTIRAQVQDLELTPAQIAAVADALLARVATTTTQAEEEQYSLANLYAVSGNLRGAEAAWKALRPYAQKQDKAKSHEVDVALASVINVVESLRTQRGLRTYDELGSNDIAALVNGANETRSKLAPLMALFAG